MKTKRFLSVFFLALLLAGLLAVPARAAGPDVWSGKVADPQVQAKAALLAVSILHLSHYRNDVTVASYILAIKTDRMDSTHKEHFRNMVGNRMMQ